MQTPFKPTKEQLRAARGKSVPDVVARGLRVLFIGINPGLYTAAVGHHFAHPGNRFWPALFESGFTPRRFSPFEEEELLALGYGIVNIVGRATSRADELSAAELVEGGSALEEKIRIYGPRHSAVLGLGAYRSAFRRPKAAPGLQPEMIAGICPVWVLPNPSGLNASYGKNALVQMLREMKKTVDGDVTH
ncbi:MAG: G/U mismatch-specific DNA glycosylase [Desulfobacteraceae bacterium]|nr:G/U mismatch-specific DNA glycosylase [Desulfobacteraceae bacterium]